MASLGQSFDPNTVAPSTGGGGKLNPEGDFEFEIRETDVKPNNNGTGTVLKLVLYGTGNPDAPSDNKDMKVFVNINIAHEKAQVQAIGQGELSALCAAMGFTAELNDSDDLRYMPFWARIKHEQAKDFKNGGKLMFKDDGSPMMNAVVQRFLFDDGEPEQAAPPPEKAAPQQQQAAQPQQTQAPAPAAAGGARSWQKRKPAA